MASKKHGWIFWKDPSLRAKLADDSKLAGTTTLETLVRELIQNAVDARAQDPARLVVEDGTANMQTLWEPLCLEDLQKHIEGTLDYAKMDNPNSRIIPKCEGQLALLKSQFCHYLKFSDYNTKGLEGLSQYDKTKALWKLILDDGTSSKSASSAGGVGVGKNATFPFSKINTVLYATRTEEGYGLVGSARLNSSRIDGVNYQPEGNLLVYDDYEKVVSGESTSIKALGEDVADNMTTDLFKRDELGSDVIILGTDGNAWLSDPLWGERFALYALINFYPAIRHGVFSLEVKQSGEEPIVINSETAVSVLEDLAKADEDNGDLSDLIHMARLIIQTMADQEQGENYKKVKHSDETIGEFTLYMNASPEIDAKKWQMFRSFGMKTITRDVRLQRPVFSIVTIDSKEGSDYLLAAESGNHTEYDYQPLGEKAWEVQDAIKRFEKWVAQEIGAFGRVDSSATDIELAGLTNFIALPDDIKSSDLEGGVRPTLELVPPLEKKTRSPRKPRKRDTKKPDPNGELVINQKEKWNHDENGHKQWDDQRDTKGEDVSATEKGGKTSYDKTITLQGTFRDVHDPFSDKAEILGRIESASYRNKQVDVTVLAVSEQGGPNAFLPKIEFAIDLVTGERITDIEDGVQIKGVLVGDDQFVHLEVHFSAPFRSSLIEAASVVKHIEIENKKEKSK